MPTVTAIVPAFNRAGVLPWAIASIRDQDLPPDWTLDIVVVDDGSAEPLAVPDARVIRHERNRGAAAARNTGIAAAQGDLIAFLDSDDIWLPGKLAAQIAAMAANDWPASCTAYVLAKPGRPDIVSPRYQTGTLGLDELVWGCFVSPGSTLVCRRAVFDEIGPMDATLPRLEDWDWLLRYAARHRLGFLAEPLARIEPSTSGGVAKVAAALDILRAKHGSSLSRRHRRHFAAALEMERAAACHRAGDRLGMLRSVVTSLLHAPFGNAAARAVLHNRLPGGG